jgi:ABC-2 type transport system permease protein
MKQFIAFIRKEFYHVFRDSKTLLLLFGMPIVQILLFGFALTNEIKNADIVVCDYAHDEASRQITDKLEASTNFDIQHSNINAAQIEQEFKKGKIKLAVVIPANFEQDLQHLKTAQIQIIADASDPNTATTLTSYVNNIINDYQQQQATTGLLPIRLKVETRMIYNPELKGTTNFVPGVMALVLLLITVLMTSVSIVREKELGTMEVLLVSPFNPLLVIISKAVPYLALSLVNLVVILLLSVYVLDMPIQGSVALIFAESMLFILTSLSLGLLISNVTSSQQTAMLFALMGMMLPTVILTGFMFPIENMPLPLQVISNVLPSKWYYIIIKSLMVKGLGLADIWKETLILGGMTVFFILLSLKNFKTRLA